MEDPMISERFKRTVLKELKLADFDLQDELQANQVPGWDSLTHANVIDALEREYKIRLKNVEILNCDNLGDLQRLIDSKLTEKNK
jgi:acyl carrier protein